MEFGTFLATHQLQLTWYSKLIKPSYLIPIYDISSTGDFSTPNVALIQTISKSHIHSNRNKIRIIPFSKYNESPGVWGPSNMRGPIHEIVS